MLHAIAYIRGGPQTPQLTGTARFLPDKAGVLVEVRVSGLPAQRGFFALHIHEGDSCAGETFARTGNHYNPDGKPHPDHRGDLPPLLSCDGKAYLAVLTDRFTVEEIIGRTVVIHSGADDFRTQPAGNAGTKIACGEIRGL